MKKLFVDGASGTVGAALAPYLAAMCDEGLIALITLDRVARRCVTARQDAMRQADLVVLCLPDAEAAAAVALLKGVNPHARVLDASAAHRCNADWVYGLPEVTSNRAIAQAQRVANPGCFATACILAGRPLAGLVGPSPLAYQGITGYSAGGASAKAEDMPMLVQFGREHRHLAEIERYTGALPVLTTMVGPWRQGMLVQTYVPLPEDQVILAYETAYRGNQGIDVARASMLDRRVSPQCCNGSNDVVICVAGQPSGGSSVAVVLDNLGKGSAGAAADNLRLMLTVANHNKEKTL